MNRIINRNIRHSDVKRIWKSTFIFEKIRPKINICGYRWDFHLKDSDFWPCVGHGHTYDKRLKLDIYNGFVYSVSAHKIVDNSSDKEMTALWSDKKFLKFVLRARAEYLTDNPYAVLPELPVQYLTHKHMIRLANSKRFGRRLGRNQMKIVRVGL